MADRVFDLRSVAQVGLVCVVSAITGSTPAVGARSENFLERNTHHKNKGKTREAADGQYRKFRNYLYNQCNINKLHANYASDPHQQRCSASDPSLETQAALATR